MQVLLRHIALCTVATLVAFQPTRGGDPPPLGLTSRCQVTRVVDGDTLDVVVSYKIRVRLDTCWAPEKNTAAGKKAAEDLDVHALGKEAVLHIPTGQARSLADVLTLNRVVGTVWLKDARESLSEYQVRMKNATPSKPK